MPNPPDDDFYADILTPPPEPPPVKVGRRPRTKNASVRLDGVDPDLVNFAGAQDAVVTSGRDSLKVHMPGSGHGRGNALDLRTRDKTPEQVRQMQQAAEGAGLKATFERGGMGRATGDHLHLTKQKRPSTPLPPAQPDENDFYSDILPQETTGTDDFYHDILSDTDVSQDVSRQTPQVTSQPPTTSPLPPATAPPLPSPALPGAREGVSQAPTLPQATPPPQTPPPVSTTERVSTEPEGGQPPSVNFPALDRPGYSDALHDLIAARGLKSPQQLLDYVKWLDEAGRHGDLADPAFRAQVVSGHLQAPRAPAASVPAVRRSQSAPSGAPQQGLPAPAPSRMDAPAEPLPVAPQSAPQEQPAIENGVVTVGAQPDATAESIIYSAFREVARDAKLPEALADQYARHVASASQGFQQGEAFVQRARERGQASVRVRPEHLQLLNQYLGGYQSGANIEAQMTADTGIIQSSTDEQRRREEEIRKEVEPAVTKELDDQQQRAVITNTPPLWIDAETRAKSIKEETDSRVNQRLAIERIHGELSQLVVDRPRFKEEMRRAVEQEFRESETDPSTSKARQEYAGMTAMLPGMRMREIDRLAEERTQSLLNDIDYAKRATDPNVAVGVVESIYQRFRKNPLVLLPVVSTLVDLQNTLDVYGASQRTAAAQARGQAPEQRDQLTLQAYQASQHVNKTFWAQVGDVLVEQPAFWGEFYLTGGMASTIEEGVGRGLARVGIKGLEEGADVGTGAFKSRLGSRLLGEEALAGTKLTLAQRSLYTLGDIASKTVQTAFSGVARTGTVGAPRVAENYVERRMRGEDGPTAFLHASLDVAGEYISESQAQGEVLELMPGMKRLDAALRPMMERFERMGYHGVLGEIYEERWKDLYDVVTGLKTWAEVKQKWEDPRTWGVEAVGFALPGVGGAMYGHARQALSSMRQEYATKAEEARARVAELSVEPQTEETATAVAEAREDERHYTGLVEQIDAHEQDAARQESEIAAVEQEVRGAETVRGDQGQVQGTGDVGQGGEIARGADIQRGASEQPHEPGAPGGVAEGAAGEGGSAAAAEIAYRGLERRSEGRDWYTDLKYFERAFAAAGGSIRLVDSVGGRGRSTYTYELRLGGETVRVEDAGDMKSLSAKAREMLAARERPQPPTLRRDDLDDDAALIARGQSLAEEGERLVNGEVAADSSAVTYTFVRPDGSKRTQEVKVATGGEEGGAQADEHGFRPFPAEANALGIPRSTMPQIKSEHRGALVQYLRGRGVEHEQMMVRPSALKPAQAEYSPEKVQAARSRAQEGGPNRPVLVSGDGYVLDGTHQWRQALEDAPDEPYPVIAFHADAKDLLPLIADMPSSYANKESEGGPKEAPLTAESFADDIMREIGGGEEGAADYPTTVLDVIRSPEHPGNVRPAEELESPAEEELYRRAVEVTRNRGRLSTSLLQREIHLGYGPASRFVQRMRDDGTVARYGIVDAHVQTQQEAAPSEEERGPGGHAALVGRENLAQPGAAGESPNMSTPVVSATGVATTATTEAQRAEIRARREGIKTKLAEARRKRMQAAGADPERGEELRHGGPVIPSREEVVLTAELLLTYAQEGTLLFKDAARRFRDDLGAEYARELARAFEAGWRLLKKKGFDADEAGSLAEHLEESDGSDDNGDGAAGDAGDVREGGGKEGAPREGGEEAAEDTEEYLPPDPLEEQADDPVRVSLGRKFARALLEGRKYPSITHARRHAAELLGAAVDAGTNLAKDVDEAVEIGVGIAARETVRELREAGKDDATIYRHLVHLYTEQQPNLSVRTSTSALEQAYSTPAPLAFVASRLAGINRRTSVLGNTAGNGMLLMEAAPEAVTANEKNPSRFAALQALFPLADVRQGDALTLDVNGKKFDRYIENPPFGTVKDAGGEMRTFEPLPGYRTNEIDHAIAFEGLSHLADRGRAVLIVGSVKNEIDPERRKDQYDAKAKRLFYYHLYQNYNVADHFSVSGDLYERQGAGWPVDVIVIDGRGKSSRRLPAAEAPRVYRTWDELAEVLSGEYVEPAVSGVDAGDRPEGQRGGSTRGGGADTRGAGTPGRGDVSDVSGRPGAGDVGAGASADSGPVRTGEAVTERGTTGERAGNEESERNERGVPRSDTGEPGPAGATEGDGRAGQAAQADIRGQSGGEAARAGDESRDVDELRPQPPERAKVDISKTQVPYAPSSTARRMNTLTPVNMATAAQDALDALIKRLGGVRGDDTLDRYLADRLGYTLEEVKGTDEEPGYFGAEQVDAIALAIDNIERGAGMINGDQTGIGKGRTVAAVLRYARRRGLTPIFITEKPNLYKDMVRDLEDIGEGTVEELRDRILMTNANQIVPLNDDEANPIVLRTPDAATHNERLRGIAARGTLPDNIDYVFSTYSQIQKRGGITERQEFLDAMAPGAMIVLDESHNAGGTENSGWGSKKNQQTGGHDPLSRAGFARGLIDAAQGVYYSSATFAKRPSVMDLYSKTDMRLSVSNTPLADMIAKGGVPLQQIVSAMLVESGQMVRRERSFDGIEYRTAVAPVDQESAETVATVMKAVFDFDKIKKAVAKDIKDVIREAGETFGVDPATGAISASSTSFSSLIHNLVDQMLLSLKMRPTIEHALEALRNGEKPVITVALTFGSFLEQYAEEFNLQPGEAVGLNFGDMLKRYLDRTREMTYKRPDGTKYRVRLTDEQLGPAGVAAYSHAVELIQGADWSMMPMSPIDYIKYRIQQEMEPETGRAYRVGEITGRGIGLDYSEHFLTNGEAAPVLRRRPQAENSIRGRVRQIVGFNNGSIDVMILNQAGSTGLSLHASERVSDRRPRHMIIAQPERNIDTHMQLLGRIHRTGQVVLPRYTQLVADVPSEKRPAAVLAKKMASLNANTTASRGSKFKAESVVDFMNQYGDQVAYDLMQNNPDLHDRLGEPLKGAEGEYEKEDAARKVTGRLPILPLEEQTAIYDELEQEYTDLIERLNALGENALEAQTLPLDAKTLKKTTIFDGTGERPFERGAVAENVDVKLLRKPYSPAQVLDLVRKTLTKRFAELKAVEHVPEGDDLGRLANAGEFLQGYQHEATKEEFDEFLKKELESIVTSPKKDETEEETKSRAETRRRVTETRHREVWRRWQDVHSRYHIGQTVQVVSGATGDMYGVITDISRKGKAANPATLGAWKLTVALADAARSVNVPFSKIRISTATAEGRDAAGEYDVTPTDEASIFDYSALKRVTVTVLEAFERGQSVSREKRTIITGNLLAGFGRFEKSRGQIVNFTDDEGNLRQGILMPKDFDVEKALDEEPVVFKDARQVMTFLQSTPGLVTTPDGHFKIVRQGANDFKFSAPKAKTTGQQYWGNRALLDAAGKDFVTKGDAMVLVLRTADAQRVIEAALLQGWTLHTTTHKERAREITGTRKKGGASGGLDNLASPIKDRVRRPTSKAEQQGKRADEAEGGGSKALADGASRPATPLLPDDAKLPGLGMTVAEVKDAVQTHLEEVFHKDEVELIDLAIIGSRVKGTAREGSDLDVVFEYGSIEDFREDDVFNRLNDEEFGQPLYLEGVKVDLNPVREDNSGTLGDWLSSHGYAEDAGPREDLASPRAADNRASSKGSKRSLTDLPDATGGAVEGFSLSERARDILGRLGVPIHERTLSSRLLGLFKLRTKAVRVQALPDVFTVAHEGMHAISEADRLGERLIADTSRGHYLRQDLTRIYTEFYPDAKPSHALKKRVEEGLAVLMEEYLYDPAYIQTRYPRLVNAFIRDGGAYNTPRVNQLLGDMASLVGGYVRLTPEQQFGARIARGDEVVREDRGFAAGQRYVYEVHNDVEPLRRLGLLGYVSETRFDPDVAWVQWKGKTALFNEWLHGRLGLIIPKLDGTYDVVKGVSVRHYLDLVKNDLEVWDQFLAARRVVADHNRISDLRAEAADPLTDPERKAEATAEADELAAVLVADNLPGLPKAVAVVTKYADRFKEAVKIFDQVSKAVVDLSYETGLISREYRDKLNASKGYAPFFKLINDELRAGKPDVYGTPARPAVKGRAFRRRSGSEQMLLPPTFNQMTSIAEQLSKGMENIIWRRVLDLAEENTEIARRFEPVSAQEAGADEHGRVTRPDIVKVMVDGRPEYRKAAAELLAVAQALHPQQLKFFGKLLLTAARALQILSTTINPYFGIFKNLPMDQVSAALNTRTGYVPYKDAAKTLPIYLSLVVGRNIKGVDAADVERMEEYMAIGGRNINRFAQTHYDESPEKVILGMLGKGGVAQKAAHGVEKVMTVGELPSNISELMTRFAEYSRALEQGDTEAEALYKAAEVTTNFHRIGHWWGGQTWARSVAFLPSSFAVLYKFGRQIHEDPKRVAFVAGAIAVAALGSALTLLKFLDDDKYREQRKEFMDAPVDDLQRFIYLPNPFGRHLIRVAVPNELGAVTGTIYLYAIQFYGGNTAARDELLDTVAAPLPEQLQWQKPGRAAWSLVPTFGRPTLQAIANQQTYPNLRPIVPDRLKDKEPYLQAGEYTTDVSKWMAYQLRDTPLAVSPIKLDFWIRAQFGPVGALLTTGKLPSVPLFDQEKEYQAAERAFDRFKSRQQAVEWQYQRLTEPGAKYSPEEQKEIVAAYTLYDKMGDVLAQLGKASRQTVPVPFELRERAWKAMLRLDELDVEWRTKIAMLWHDQLDAAPERYAEELKSLKKEIEEINEGVLKHLRAQKAPKNPDSGLPEGFKRVTVEGITDLDIERRQKVRKEIKLPPPGSK